MGGRIGGRDWGLKMLRKVLVEFRVEVLDDDPDPQSQAEEAVMMTLWSILPPECWSFFRTLDPSASLRDIDAVDRRKGETR